MPEARSSSAKAPPPREPPPDHQQTRPAHPTRGEGGELPNASGPERRGAGTWGKMYTQVLDVFLILPLTV